MDAKFAILENEITNLKTTLATMLLMVEGNQKKLVSMLEKGLGQKQKTMMR